MNYIDELLTKLSARLPELEWKISELSTPISGHSLPRGLFRSRIEYSGATCIQEIKEDIHALSLQKNQRSESFLALRINQKINVLVVLCQIQSRKSTPNKKPGFSLKMLSTRQQWIQGLESDIELLVIQHGAMAKSLAQMQLGANAAAVLNLQADLGEVERRLTLAKEALNRAIA